MSTTPKRAFSARISDAARTFITAYASTRNITISNALDEIVLKRSEEAKIEPLNITSKNLDLAQIERRLHNIETSIRYANHKLGCLPCYTGIKPENTTGSSE